MSTYPTPDQDCTCFVAVMRAYDGMFQRGLGRDKATFAAAKVMQTHHPERTLDTCRVMVESWVAQTAEA